MSAESAVGSGALSVEGIGSGGAPPLLRDHTARGFLARINAHGTANAYGFARVDEGLPATFPELEGDAAITGDGSTLAAYEITGSTSVPTDGSVIAWLEPLRGGVGYHFAYGAVAASTYGQHVLTSSTSVPTSNVWTASGLSVTVAAGTYEFLARVPCSALLSGSGMGLVYGRLYNATAGAYLTPLGASGTPRSLFQIAALTETLTKGIGVYSCRATLASTAVVQLDVYRDVSGLGTPTWTELLLVATGLAPDAADVLDTPSLMYRKL